MRRLLLLFPGALGDFCLMAPSLGSVLAEGAVVELCVQRSLLAFARLLLPAAEIGPPMDGAVMGSLFGPVIDPALAAIVRRADRVHAWLRRATDADALRDRIASLGSSVVFHAVPRDDAGRHVGHEYAAMLGLGAPPARLRMTAPPPSIELPWRGLEASRLVLHPGAGGVAKAWNREGFRRVADGWRGRDGEVCVLLGPAEEADERTWIASGHTVLAGLSLVDAAATVASAPTWLGNDAGMSHVAGLLDRRGVVLFGPTRATRWRPLGGALATVDFAGRALDAVVREVDARLDARSS